MLTHQVWGVPPDSPAGYPPEFLDDFEASRWQWALKFAAYLARYRGYTQLNILRHWSEAPHE